MHTATARPPAYTAYQYLGDANEMQAALQAATPSDATWQYTATPNGNDAVITLTFNEATPTTDVHANDWVVWFGDTLGSPTMPTVMSDADARAAYIIEGVNDALPS